MVIRTFIVNTMPRRSAEDTVSQEGGVLRARNTRPPEPPVAVWNPFQELEVEELVPVRVRAHYHPVEDNGDIPDGMEGLYYL
jgi:hypothetical protein